MNSKASQKRRFALGLGMTIAFAVVLAVIFMPVFGGVNGLDSLDNLYNSISKGSAYYIPELKETAKAQEGHAIAARLVYASPERARWAELLFKAAGAQAAVSGAELDLKGDLGRIMASALQDADAMFHNNGQALTDRYAGLSERQALHAWWLSCQAMIKALNKQKAFEQAKLVDVICKKAVEMTYNFYKVEPRGIADDWPLVVFSLLFYVLYTLWYGYGVMYLFEGVGYQLEH